MRARGTACTGSVSASSSCPARQERRARPSTSAASATTSAGRRERDARRAAAHRRREPDERAGDEDRDAVDREHLPSPGRRARAARRARRRRRARGRASRSCARAAQQIARDARGPPRRASAASTKPGEPELRQQLQRHRVRLLHDREHVLAEVQVRQREAAGAVPAERPLLEAVPRLLPPAPAVRADGAKRLRRSASRGARVANSCPARLHERDRPAVVHARRPSEARGAARPTPANAALRTTRSSRATRTPSRPRRDERGAGERRRRARRRARRRPAREPRDAPGTASTSAVRAHARSVAEPRTGARDPHDAGADDEDEAAARVRERRRDEREHDEREPGGADRARAGRRPAHSPSGTADRGEKREPVRVADRPVQPVRLAAVREVRPRARARPGREAPTRAPPR